MENAARSDPQLLAEWLDKQREPAFHALVARYAGLVLMTARRTCGDETLAAEASQLTFILLANRADSLLSCASLGGWLHRAALMHSRNLLRSRLREDRKRSELQAAMNHTPSSRPDPTWSDMQPVLDEALAALPDKDREALLLRFYRSLGVREVGATLGISKDAAQKRIDRATGRLRDYLTRRGIQAGGSLAAIMLAGFAADAQAAAPAVAGFSAQALAASSAPALASSTSLTAALSMKVGSIITPAVALLAAGIWLFSQRLSMADLEKQNAGLAAKLASAPSIPTAGKQRLSAKTALDDRPIDWKKVARQLNDGQWVNGYLISNLRLRDAFKQMSGEQLLNSLKEIAAADLSAAEVRTLEPVLYGELARKDPEAAMNFALSRRDFSITTNVSPLWEWATKDLAAATAWLDRQIAAGTLDDRSLSGENEVRIGMERILFSEVLKADPAAAGKRLEALPADQRKEVLLNLFSSQFEQLDHRIFADLVRGQLPESDQREYITWPITRSGSVPYQEAEGYLARIEATPAERTACILKFAKEGCFPHASGEYLKVQAGDLEALREWVSGMDPELKAQATLAALTSSVRKMPYPEAVAAALKYHAEDGGDAILEAVLSAPDRKHNKELSRELASKLADPARREFRLKQLEEK